MRRKTIRSMTVAGLATMGLATGLVAAPSASAEELPLCIIWADSPVYNGNVIGVGHRANCGQRRSITVRIREDIDLLPDTTVAERTWTNVVNGTFRVEWDCWYRGNFFVEILTSAGGKDQSIRHRLC